MVKFKLEGKEYKLPEFISISDYVKISKVKDLFTDEYFYPKLIQGGVIYFDDYGWHGYEKLREVVDKFFENKPEKLLHLPSGNSIIVKT